MQSDQSISSLINASEKALRYAEADVQANAMLRILITLFWFLCVSPAQALCGGLAMLSQLHDAYRALLIEKGETQIRAAQTLLVITGGNANTLARQIRKSGQNVDEQRLNIVKQNGAKLAHQVLTRGGIPDSMASYEADVSWLNRLVSLNDCSAATPYTPPRWQQSRQAAVSSLDDTSEDLDTILVIKAVLAMLAATGIGFGIYVVRKSRRYREKVVQRMPRKTINAEFDIMFTNQDGNHEQKRAKAVDFSAGGMKLEWPDNETAVGSALTIHLSSGPRLATILWSNAFYAGIMFEDHLSREEMKSLTAESMEQMQNGAEPAPS